MSEASQLRGRIGEEDEKVLGTDGPADRAEEAEEALNVFGTAGGACDYFEAPGYRPGQREALEEIEDAFEQGYRYVVLDAPTGSGKSHIANALARQSGGAHILTIQKMLQSQYQKDFPGMYVMYGRSSYRSPYTEDPVTGERFNGHCGNCPCRRGKKYEREDCPYKLARLEAQQAAITVHNFDSFYYQTAFARAFAGRKLMVVDEAHNIGSKFLDFMSFTITNKNRRSMVIPQYEEAEEYHSWLGQQFLELSRSFQQLDNLKKVGALTDSQVADLDDVGKLVARIGKYLQLLESGEGTEYVVDYADKGVYQSVTFRPVFVGGFTRESLFPYGERTLMMSATILDKEMFCREVGLDPDEVAYIEMDSTFPAENRRVVYDPAGSMSFRNINATLPRLADSIRQILARHPNRRGIIQTHSERIAEYIKWNIRDRRLTFNKDFDRPEEMLEVHAQKPGSFIVASGLREGLDLAGDLSKVQVMCKVPYPSLGDKRVKRRMEIEKPWYGYQTSLMFVQSLGRSVRSSTDKAVTYLLDEDFKRFVGMNKRFIPDYVKKAIIW